MKHETREQWLEASVKLISEVFKENGYTVPKVKVSIGFTGSRDAKLVLGSCWSADASDDKICQIFIVPTQDCPFEIQSVLTHELVHATVENKAGHGSVFRKCAVAIGLEGKMTSTVAGDKLKERLNAFFRRSDLSLLQNCNASRNA